MILTDKHPTITTAPTMTATALTPLVTVIKSETPPQAPPPPVPAPAMALPRDMVFYRLSQYDAASVTARRKEAGITGNPVEAGETYPALVVRRWTYSTVNLRVLLDGPDDMWLTSRTYGEQPGQWRDYPGSSE